MGDGKNVKSIHMSDAFYQRIRKHARKRHMSASGWLNAAAEEKLEREAAAEEERKERRGGK